jgi:hypothetical protein
MYLALSKVLDILGEPSRNATMQYIQNKYGISIHSGRAHQLTLEEIEDTMEELFTIGASLIIQMIEAELKMMDENLIEKPIK